MRILVTGGNGLLGKKIYDFLEKNDHNVFFTYNQNKIEKENYYYLDITGRDQVFKIIEKISPDVVIHTAALTNVDECERDKNKAYDINVNGTKNIVTASKKISAKVAFISTDFVFNGKKGMYKEDDSTDPINYYGVTKLEGENIVSDYLDDYIIARTSVLYGWNDLRKNFVTWVIDQLKIGNKIKVAKDMFNSPTLADNLAEILIKLLFRDETGIFHISGSERISRYDFASKIINHFNLQKDLIEPVSSDQLDLVAKRPKDASLDVSKISKIKNPLNIDDGLRIMKESRERTFGIMEELK